MAGLSKFLGAIPPMNLKAVVATASLGAGIAFYVNRRIHDARYVATTEVGKGKLIDCAFISFLLFKAFRV